MVKPSNRNLQVRKKDGWSWDLCFHCLDIRFGSPQCFALHIVTIVTFSTKYDSLTNKEIETVNGVMQAMVNNAEPDIQLDREYYTGRVFTKYLNLNGKGVVIRLTRWSSECSVSMSQSDTSKGRELLEAFKPLLQVIAPYLNRGSEWAAVSNNTDRIDYYVRKPYRKEKEAPLQPVLGYVISPTPM